MTSKGVAGFYNTEPMLIYQHQNADPSELGVKLLNEFKQIGVADQFNYFAEELFRLESLPEEALIQDVCPRLKTDFRRNLPSEIFRPNAQTVYDLFEPLQGTLMPYLENRIKHFPDGAGFLKDSFFCEWGYVLNTEHRKFEILRGNIMKNPRKTIYGSPSSFESHGDGNVLYYPCEPVKSYPVDDLPSEKQFLEDLAVFR